MRAGTIVMFFFLFNISVGMINLLMSNFVTDLPIYYEYNDEDFKLFSSEMDKAINPENQIEAAGDQIYRVLDLLNLGFLIKIWDFIQMFLFGGIVIIERIVMPFATGDNVGFMKFLFSSLKGVLFLIYVLSFYELFFAKRFVEEK